MQIVDHGAWVRMTPDIGKDLINVDGYRVKNVSCPVADQSAWSEVLELPAILEYGTGILLTEDKMFLRSLQYDFEAIKMYVDHLRDQDKISHEQYITIADKMILRRDAMRFYRENKTTMTVAQLKTCLDRIL